MYFLYYKKRFRRRDIGVFVEKIEDLFSEPTDKEENLLTEKIWAKEE